MYILDILAMLLGGLSNYVFKDLSRALAPYQCFKKHQREKRHTSNKSQDRARARDPDFARGLRAVRCVVCTLHL